MYTKISDYVTCYNPYCIAIHIAYDNPVDNNSIFFILYIKNIKNIFNMY